MEPYIGQIQLFGFYFAPRGWMLCQGQIISIAQNTALFSLLGTTFGGNGQTTFALPHLGGRVAVGQGQAPGVGHNYQMGEVAGSETTTLTTNNMPAHTHPMTSVLNGTTAAGTSSDPSGRALANAKDINTDPANIYATGGSAVALSGSSVNTTAGVSGGSQPFSIVQPYLTLNYCIAIEGIFPSRN